MAIVKYTAGIVYVMCSCFFWFEFNLISMQTRPNINQKSIKSKIHYGNMSKKIAKIKWGNWVMFVEIAEKLTNNHLSLLFTKVKE